MDNVLSENYQYNSCDGKAEFSAAITEVLHYLYHTILQTSF